MKLSHEVIAKTEVQMVVAIAAISWLSTYGVTLALCDEYD